MKNRFADVPCAEFAGMIEKMNFNQHIVRVLPNKFRGAERKDTVLMDDGNLKNCSNKEIFRFFQEHLQGLSIIPLYATKMYVIIK